MFSRNLERGGKIRIRFEYNYECSSESRPRSAGSARPFLEIRHSNRSIQELSLPGTSGLAIFWACIE